MDNPLVLQQALLLAVLVLPLLAAGLAAWRGHSSRRTARRVALSASALHLGLTLILVGTHAMALDTRDPAAVAPAFQPAGVPGDPSSAGQDGTGTFATAWGLLTLTPASAAAPAAEAQFFVGVDGLNVWLVALTSVMGLVAVLLSWDSVRERPGAYYAWLLVLQTALLGAFCSFDILLFYVFFELTLIPAFFLIGGWGVGSAKRVAARKFFLYTLFGSLFTLVGIVGVVVANPTPVTEQGRVAITVARAADGSLPDLRPGPVSFSIPRLMLNAAVWSDLRAARAEDARRALRRAAADAALGTPANPNAGAAAARAQADVTKYEAEAASRSTLQVWLFFALMAGFAVKIPIVPFHTWLPGAYAEAPLAVTMLLSALLAKLGAFGVLRVVLPLTPDAALAYGPPVFGTLGAVGVVYGAFCAFAQRDLKLLVAYSSVSHLGFLVMGLFTATREGLAGSALHMVNHGLSTGAMFALLGFLAHRYGTLDINRYGGLLGRFPAFAFWFLLASLASIGLPGLNNFVSEMLMLAGLVDPAARTQTGWALPAAAVAGILLSAWYTLTMIRRVFFGPLVTPAPLPAEPGVADDSTPDGLNRREQVAFSLPATLCVVLGLFPQPFLAAIAPDAATVARLGEMARARAQLPPG